jgi:hypothetical protein
MTITYQDRVEEALGTALAEHILNQLPNPQDKEARRYVLKDINGLLLTAGPGAEVEPMHLQRPTLLQSHLEASMQIPAQTPIRHLPNRLEEWMKSRPSPNSPERAAWAEKGRWLLDQSRLNQDESR